MTKLVWDKVGERLYETGLDQGVLYLADGTGIPWNGLTSIEEDMSGDTSAPAYYDGVKYLDIPATGDYAATLNAFTYPDEFLEFEGVADLGNGILVDGQASKLFGLSYRTKVGNDVDGVDHGYKIHILYNLTATPNAMSYQTLTSTTTPLQFSWRLTGVPSDVPYYRPTAHVIFDSRYLNAAMLVALEDLLYGDSDSQATLPTLSELVDFVSFWDPKRIIPQSVTGLANLVDGTGDLTMTDIDGIYSALPSTRLVAYDVDGFYVLGLGRMVITYLGNGVWTAEDSGGEYITMTDATTFSITSPSAIFLDADTYEISSHD